MIIIVFTRIFEKGELCEISLQYIRNIYFYSSVHFYIDCWICRKVSKWIHRKVHSQDHGTRNTSLVPRTRAKR